MTPSDVQVLGVAILLEYLNTQFACSRANELKKKDYLWYVSIQPSRIIVSYSKLSILDHILYMILLWSKLSIARKIRKHGNLTGKWIILHAEYKLQKQKWYYNSIKKLDYVIGNK